MVDLSQVRLREEAAKFDERPLVEAERRGRDQDRVLRRGLPLAPRQGALAPGERRERRGAARRAPELRRARPAGGGGQGRRRGDGGEAGQGCRAAEGGGGEGVPGISRRR